MQKISKRKNTFIISIALLLTFAGVSLFAQNAIDPQLLKTLSTQEVAWLQTNPKIKVLFHKTDYKPVWTYDTHYLSGISPDYLKYVLKYTGLSIDTVVAEWETGVNLLYNKQIDLIVSIVKTEERAKKILFSDPQIVIQNCIVSREGNEIIPTRLSQLSGAIIAKEKGFYSKEFIENQATGVIFHVANSSLEAIKAVASGKADYYLGNYLNAEYIKTEEDLKIKITLLEGLENVDVCFGVNMDKPLLQSIINKAIKIIPESDKETILVNNNATSSQKTFMLFEHEEEYLKQVPEIIVAYKSFRAPLEFLDKDGKLNGLIPDIIDIIFEDLNLNIKKVFYNDFNVMLRDAEAGKIDIVASLNHTEERAKYLLFTHTYLRIGYVAIGNRHDNNYRKFEQLEDKKIGIYAGFWLGDDIAKNFPKAKVFVYNTYVELYDALTNDKIDVGITNKIAYNYYRQLKKYSKLHLYFETEYSEKCCIAIHPRNAGLIPILNRKISYLPISSRDLLIDKWETTPPPQEYDLLGIQNIMFAVAGLLLFFALFFWFLYYRIKQERNRTRVVKSQLEKSEYDYERVFNTMSDVYFRTDLRYKLERISPSVEKILGYSPSEVIGKPDVNFYYDLETREKMIELLTREKVVSNFRVILKHKNGQPIYCSINISLLFEKGRLVASEGIVRDISKLIADEKAVTETTKKLDIATRVSDLGISEYDKNLSVFNISETLSKNLFGNFETKSISLFEFKSLVHPDDLASFEPKFERLLQSKSTEFRLEFRIATEAGFKWFNNRYTIFSSNKLQTEYQILGAHQNIDLIKSSLVELQHSQRKLEAIYNAVNIMLIVVDQNLVVHEINDIVPAEMRMLKEKIVGTHIDKLLKSVSPDEFQEIIKGSLESKENVYNQEIDLFLIGKIEHVKPDTYNISTNVFSFNGGHQILISLVDITERKKSEFEYMRIMTLLEEKEKAKADFLSNLSYELRTPVNSIMGFVGLLKNKSISIDQKEKYVDIIMDSSTKILETISDVVELSKVEFGEVELNLTVFNISDFLQEVFKSYKSGVKAKGLDFVNALEIAQDLEAIRSDHYKLRQVVSHLIENAIKFTEAGFIKIGAYYEKNDLWFFVEDSGIGIRNADNIFDNFDDEALDKLNSDDKKQGFGISLSLCRAYVEALGGQISIDTNQTSGTKISFFIDPKRDGLFYPEKKSKKEIEKKNQKILVVEDEDFNYKYLGEILEMEGYDYVIADDGEKAVELAKSILDIDLVLMDIKLPGIDGLEASKLIKSFRPDLPIIAQTAYNLDREEDNQMEKYCDDYIQKPIVSNLLMNKIEKFLKK